MSEYASSTAPPSYPTRANRSSAVQKNRNVRSANGPRVYASGSPQLYVLLPSVNVAGPREKPGAVQRVGRTGEYREVGDRVHHFMADDIDRGERQAVVFPPAVAKDALPLGPQRRQEEERVLFVPG